MTERRAPFFGGRAAAARVVLPFLRPPAHPFRLAGNEALALLLGGQRGLSRWPFAR